jgi:hypothetical protein
VNQQQVSVLIENQAIVDKLMAFVFNPMKDKLDIAAAVPPFVPEPFFSTHLFKETIGGEHRKFESFTRLIWLFWKSSMVLTYTLIYLSSSNLQMKKTKP